MIANKARPLAITLPERSPLYPDLPTLAAFPSFTTTGSWPSPCPISMTDPARKLGNAPPKPALALVQSPKIHSRA